MIDLGFDHHILLHGLRFRGGKEPVPVELRVADLRVPEQLEGLEPVRQWRANRHQIGRARMQPVASVGVSAPCESRLEAMRVIELDRTGSLAWLVMQPFWITAMQGRKRLLRHAPDLLYGTRDGRVLLENVRPPERRNAVFERKSALCASLCASADLEYAVAGAYGEVEAEMLWYLWQYSVVSPLKAVTVAVREAFAEQASWRLSALRERCGGVVAHASVLALVWRQVLSVEMREPLSGASWVDRGRRWSW